MFFWTGALIEITVIFANKNYVPQISSGTLSFLVRGSNASNSVSNIRITPIFLLGWFINLIGAYVRASCYRVMGPQFTFELGIRKDHKLITSGPYSIVRHPSYTGSALAIVGVVLCHLASGSWVVECSGLVFNSVGTLWWIWTVFGLIVTGVLVLRIKKEDEMLKKQFGKDWVQWTKVVPYRLIPCVY